ncbi:HYR domain-containing protein, partial [Winogradskyella sp. A3E31]|uniref:HYR domain-containing protein n=1 Tax=Winogradskyella sp. A3E31 TaxID=3349637 RepID=UPI00398B28AB
MKTNTYKMLRKTLILLVFLGMTNAYAQIDGSYCPGPGDVGDEYAGTQTFSPDAMGTGTCAIQQIWADIDIDNEFLKLGFKIGNSGTALFRVYIDTDNNPTTGLISDTFGGPLVIAGAEYILQINSNNGNTTLFQATGPNTKIQIPPNGLIGENGDSNGCFTGNGGDGRFFEFYIPFASINFDLCNQDNPGEINIAQYASVSGGSANSSFCLGETLDFTVELSGSVEEDQEICLGETPDELNVIINGGTNNTIVTWQISTDDGANYTDINNTAGLTSYTPDPSNPQYVAGNDYYYRVEVQNTDVCPTTYFTTPAIITVIDDDEGPTITCPTPNSSYNADNGLCSTSLSFTATATDNCTSNPSIVYSVGGNVITFPYDFPVGTTTVMATASDDNSNASSCTFNVVVEDNQDPTFNETLPGNVTVECDNIPDPAVLTASDNCPGVLVDYDQTRTDGSCPDNYQLTRTWTATDASNNSITHTQIITVQDTTPPNIDTQASPLVVECDGSGNTTQYDAWLQSNGGAAASDNCDDDVSFSFVVISTTNNCGGTLERLVRFNATDDCNNTSFTEATFTIVDTTAPSLTVPADETVECTNPTDPSATGTATG